MIPAIQGADLADYGVRHVVKSYVNPALSPVTIKTGGMLSPYYVRTDAEPHGIQLKLWLQGANKDDTMQKLLGLAAKMEHCELTFPDEPSRTYICTLLTAQSSLSTSRRAVMTLDMNCDILSAWQEVTITSSPQTIVIAGARKTNLNIRVIASSALNNYRVNDIGITCGNGQSVYIDSENGLADMTKVDLIRFPQAVGNYTVTVSSLQSATVKISYRARW